MNPFVYLIGITLLPYIELRGSIPIGIAMGLSPFVVFLVCTIVNILLIFPIFFFLDYFFHFIEHWKIVKKTLDKIHKKTKKYVDKYGILGLLIFVAIPLPGSGVYSGSLAAYVFGTPRKKSIVAIALGATIAGVVVTLLFLPAYNLVSPV